MAVITACLLVAVIYFFGDRTPAQSKVAAASSQQHGNEGISIDTILQIARKDLTPEQVTRLSSLENSVIRGDVKSQQLNVYHQLAHFWKDSARRFEPYAWYEAEAARLENSEKSLNFAAHLILDNLRSDDNHAMRKWKAEQAQDLFERSLKINPQNDSTKVGLAATRLFGNLGQPPMESIREIREVAERDSTQVFPQMMLGHGSVISGQYDRAIERFEKVTRLQPGNLEATMMLAEVYERKAEIPKAIEWYQRAMGLISNPFLKEEIAHRIEELKKN